MLKHILLASSMIVALPVAAQAGGNIRPADAGQAQTAPQSRTTDTAVSSDMSAPADQTQATAPQQATPAAQPAPAGQPATTQVAPQQATGQQPGDATAVASGQAATTQTATGDQVAQVVDQQFPTYDKDGNGQLSQTEFSAWMVALKSQTDPKAKADSPDTVAWVKGAFAQADKDKSRAVSKPELLGFLNQGKS